MMDWQQVIRRILQLLGVIERKDTAVRRRLAAINQNKPRGSVSVVLEELGPKKISAVTAVRKVTGLNLEDALILAEEMLPFPILTNVDQETAELAQEILETMGARVRLVGHSVPARRPSKRATETKARIEPDMGVVVPMPALEPEPEEGEYVVVLEDASLLPERVAQVLVRLTGWSQEEAAITVDKLPQPILLGVAEETAFRAQRELQMLGAVVDVLLWAEYDSSS
jgi:ribosomal protein L7/L12